MGKRLGDIGQLRIELQHLAFFVQNLRGWDNDIFIRRSELLLWSRNKLWFILFPGRRRCHLVTRLPGYSYQVTKLMSYGYQITRFSDREQQNKRSLLKITPWRVCKMWSTIQNTDTGLVGGPWRVCVNSDCVRETNRAKGEHNRNAGYQGWNAK